jgi:hypothetical protein
MKLVLIHAAFYLILYTSVIAQQNNSIDIIGEVVDDETGATLENVNVFLATTSMGTTTGKNGEFNISNVPLCSELFQTACLGSKTKH